MNSKTLLAIVIPLLFLSGCMTQAETAPQKMSEPIERETFNLAWGYQFNYSLPTSIENITDFTLKEDTLIEFDIWSRFHEPLDWEKGYGNISIYGPDNYTWFWQTQQTNHTEVLVNPFQAGNYTLRIHTSGTNNESDYPGDVFIVYTEVSTWN